MQIAIMGAGGLGGYYGGMLARAEEDVTLIARGPHLEAILSKGLTVKLPTAEEFNVKVKATNDPGSIGTVDLILTVMGHYTRRESGFFILHGGPDGYCRDRTEFHPTDASSIRISVADLNNNGHLDLIVTNSTGARYYNNGGEEQFSDISSESGLGALIQGNRILPGDFDHEGDLDIYIANAGPNLLFRNNLDGSFSEMAEVMKIDGGNASGIDAVFGDFDDDGDLDIVVINTNDENKLFSNLRQGQFEDITQASALGGEKNNTSVVAGDYNNDGRIDLFMTGESGTGGLFRNVGEGIFEKVLKIIEFGHNIGLHFEHHFYNNNKKKLEENLRSEKKILEKIFSVDVKVFSFDSPTLSNALNVSDNKISSMVNAYGQRIKNNYHYCTDSNGYWRFERLADVLESREYPYLHILTHPGWWQKNPMKPRQRVERCVKHRGLETLKIYDKILKETGRKNIG